MSALIKFDNGMQLGPLGKSLVEIVAHDGAAGLAQFVEHSVGGPGGVNIPYINIPASMGVGAVLGILGVATKSPLLREAAKGIRSSAIAVAGAAMGLERYDKAHK